MLKIITITEVCKGEDRKPNGYQARVFGKNPPVQCFADTEIKALEFLLEMLKKKNDKFIISKKGVKPQAKKEANPKVASESK